MNNETRNRIIWIVLFLAFFVFVASGDSQTRQQQTVERLYIDWIMSGGYVVEAQRAEAEKEFKQRLAEKERKQKLIDAVNLTAEIEQKLFLLRQRVMELNHGLAGKLQAETEQVNIVPILELSEKNNRLWELEKQERGKELEKLAEEIHEMSEKVRRLTK